MSPTLPVDAILDELEAALEAHGCAVVCAPPGSGKTTRIPAAILDRHPGAGAVWVLQPRRLAARSVAAHVARVRGVALGEEVGYQVRFDSRCGPRTRLLVMTEGVLTRRLQEDPFLEGVGCLVLDEFHERSLHLDLALALAATIRREARPDLRLVVMSATLEAAPVARYLDDCPVIETAGRSHPVEIAWLEQPDRRPMEELAAEATRAELERPGGDVLVFLPGRREIRRTGELLAETCARRAVALRPLHGGLSPEEQEAAITPGPVRKVVLATNVAETSVTIDGVDRVIDTGWVRRLYHDPRRGIDRLERQRISRASADQRAGRAGRTAPGRVLRLWTRPAHRELAARETPEIHRLDLSGPLLEVCGFGAGDPRRFPWFEAPRDADLARAEALLRDLGALPESGWTPTARGRRLLRLPLPPRLGCLVLKARALGVPRAGALVAALLTERDPFPADDRDRSRPTGPSDVLLRTDLLASQARARHVAPIRRAAEQILRRSGGEGARAADGAADPDLAIRRALLAAFPDRVARRTAPGSRSARLVGGLPATLVPSSVVREAELFVVVEGDGGGGAAMRIRQASAIEPEWLEEDLPGSVLEEDEVRFDARTERVVTRRTRRYRDLVLDDREAGPPDPGRAAEALEAAIRARREAFTAPPEADRPALERLRWIAEQLPELEWPALDEGAIVEAWVACCPGRRSLAELRRAPVLATLLGGLTHAQRRALEEEAPEVIVLASGARARLRYEPGRPPVLSARVQQLFGTLETPRLARGRVPCLVEVLAPNRRPVQLTQDLGSFWRTTYARVRKDLRGRYPKHDWPESPPGA